MLQDLLQFNVFYRSDAQSHVRYVDHERKEEPYYLYYYFRPDGVWLCKTTDDPFLEAEDFLYSIDLPLILADPHHDEPMDRSQELIYQSGTYLLREDTVFLTWKHSLLEEKERRWHFRIHASGMLSTDFGEIELHPVR
jgi:hypothetical protein